MKLQDKIALVTGASKGIGAAVAVGLAKEGAHVAVNYNGDREGAERTAEQVRALGRRALVVKADIGQVREIEAMFRSVKGEFGRVDVLINNAGITGWTNLFDITQEKWDYVINTNLRGTFFCSLEAAKMMRETGGGAIVNISTNCASLGRQKSGGVCVQQGRYPRDDKAAGG